MAWTDLSAAFGYGTKLTSTQQGQLRDNAVYCYDFIASGSLTNHGILLGSGTGAITPTAVMSNGRLLVGQTGADPLPKTVSGDVTIGATGITAIGASKITQAKMADNAIGQAELKISNGGGQITQSTNAIITITGGLYSFMFQQKVANTGGAPEIEWSNYNAGDGSLTTSFRTSVALRGSTGYSTWYWQNAYVTASGEICWVFIRRDKITKEIVEVWHGDDHPCFGNGGKPELLPHPFIGYDSEKYEIVVINPSMEEVEEILLKCEVDDELEPDKSFEEVLLKEYDVDEMSNPTWPTKEVTVGLPKKIEVEVDGKLVMKPVDWRFKPEGTKITPIKKVIPKPNYIIHKSLKRRVK